MYQYRVGFGPRFGAYFLDGLFGGIIVFIALMMSIDISFIELGKLAQEDPILFQNYFMSRMLLPTLLAFAYQSVEILTGASPAKWMLGLRVAKENGEPGTSREYVIRGLLKYGSSIISVFVVISPALAMLGYVGNLWGFAVFVGCFVALGEKRQALHDMIAKTAVYRRADIGKPTQSDEQLV